MPTKKPQMSPGDAAVGHQSHGHDGCRGPLLPESRNLSKEKAAEEANSQDVTLSPTHHPPGSGRTVEQNAERQETQPARSPSSLHQDVLGLDDAIDHHRQHRHERPYGVWNTVRQS